MLGRRVSKAPVKAPADLKLTARQVHFNFLEALQNNLYWHDNDPVKTHFFNALQAMFPEGERFFMDSARDVRDMVGKENLPAELLEHIQLFIRQEATHGKVHEDWSRALVSLGYTKLEYYEACLRRETQLSRKYIHPLSRLAISAAAEHFTASLAHLFIYHRPDLVEDAVQPFRELMLYHALEELEHKAVCFDLYQKAGGGYFRRAFYMVFEFTEIMLRLRNRMRYLLQKDGLWDRAHRRKSRQLMWGRGGLARALTPFLMRYFRPGFHPWETDERHEFMARFRADMGFTDTAQAAKEQHEQREHEVA